MSPVVTLRGNCGTSCALNVGRLLQFDADELSALVQSVKMLSIFFFF